ncbi:MAG TPA: hypothetical protein DEA05_00255 [Rhodobacteraceae bacterium]|nr:hypothetical protein [Paracoccaceae bacterium]
MFDRSQFVASKLRKDVCDVLPTGIDGSIVLRQGHVLRQRDHGFIFVLALTQQRVEEVYPRFFEQAKGFGTKGE